MNGEVRTLGTLKQNTASGFENIYLAARYSDCNLCVQSSSWLQDHQPSQYLQRTVSWRETEMAHFANSRALSVMALDPFPHLSQLDISLPCCCCCWKPNRYADIFYQKRSIMLNSLGKVVFILQQTLSHYPLQIPPKDCSVFDPAFTPGEMDVLRELGMTVLTENEVSCWPVF